MKKVILCLLMAIALTACEKTPEERALDLVTDGIKRSANDPSSVQDVKLTFLKKKQEVDLHGNKTWHYHVAVDYREKNEYGGLVRKTKYIKLDEECTKVESWDLFN